MTSHGAGLLETLRRAFGRQYRLERELGRGGMGIVFLATDLALDRRVAVKVIDPELVVNRALAARFLAEARLIARIRHPHIVSVHSAGEAQGHLYYVMDFVEGETLRERLTREGPLPIESAISIAADIASAVDAAARAGVVHRDLKPENILLGGTPDAPYALLSDFGIARVADGSEGTTGPHAVMGTPAYMSPEQAAGERIDSRSDLYSLGVVAFEMLAGEPPFTGPARIVISQQIVDAPPPIEARRGGVPAPVASAIMRALEKTPEARWQSGADFRRALLGSPPPPALSRPGARRRRRTLAAVLALLLLAGVTVAGALLGRGRPPKGVNPRLSLLVLPFDNLRDDPALGWLHDGSVNMLALALSQWRDLSVVEEDRTYDLLTQARVPDREPLGLALARRLARRAGAWTVVLGDFARAGDSLRLTARTYDVATGAGLEVVEAAGRATDDVRPLFDELAARLLDLSGAPKGARSALSRVTTGSLEAYRAYLRGIERLNHWELHPAESELRLAVRLDTTFSLAYFKLGLARGWEMGTADSVGRNAVLQASRFAERLPERERTMIDAYRAMLDGEMPRSQRLYHALLDRDSTDADAWYGLGDAFFHDSVAAGTPAGMTQSLRAFRRALVLDPQYALAYEHITWLLTNAANRDGSSALVAADSFAATKPRGRALDSAALEAALRRARTDAVQTARAWVALQPATARAHHALFEAYFAGEDFAAASQEVAELRRLLPAPARELAAYLEARVRLAKGDPRGAAELVRSTTQSFEGRTPVLPDFGREFVSDVMAGANALAYQGDLQGAAAVITLGDAIRRATLLAESTPSIWDQDEVWRGSRLAQLYSAAGGPVRELRRVWSSMAQSARRAPLADRASVAGAGAAAAVGLVLAADPDVGPLAELETLTGQRSPPAVRALAALSRGDSAAARRELTDSVSPGPMGEKGSVYLGFAWNDPRPLAAEAHYQLGDYREALDLLETFDEKRFFRRGFDSRWALVGRVHLLRGLAYEHLGEADHAASEYRRVLAAWAGAEEPLLAFVQQAQAGLARLRGAVEGRS